MTGVYILSVSTYAFSKSNNPCLSCHTHRAKPVVANHIRASYIAKRSM